MKNDRKPIIDLINNVLNNLEKTATHPLCTGGFQKHHQNNAGTQEPAK